MWKEYTKFYADLSSKKVNVHLQIQGLGMRASVLPWSEGQGVGSPQPLLSRAPVWLCSLRGSNGSVSSIIGSEEMDFGFLKHGSKWKGFIGFFGFVCWRGVY